MCAAAVVVAVSTEILRYDLSAGAANGKQRRPQADLEYNRFCSTVS